ncbi:hypothetical protein [Haliangium ochraceum]|uniref:hypothetical protein n=1 Tax=Haliangium ochraceum TaxID=80816 RepID=UPI001E5386D5|nr:hypothetical protein [Haliangium ochraceum]
MLVSTFGSRARAQDVPSTELRRVLVHPERRTEIVSPERIHGYTLIGSQRIVVFPGETVLDIQPVADFVPPMTTVLQVFGERHEWTVILQAVSQPDLVRKKVKLVVAGASRSVESKAEVAAPSVCPSAARVSRGGAHSVGLHWVLGRGYVWLTTPQDSDFKGSSTTLVGVRVVRAVQPWLAAALDANISWTDEMLEFKRFSGNGTQTRELRPVWLQGALHLRAHSSGEESAVATLGAGLRRRMAGELLMAGQTSTIDPAATGLFLSLGLGFQRRFDSMIMGFDVMSDVGSPDTQWSTALLLHIGY